MLIPNKDFSKETVIGGYGVFGFEFFMKKNEEKSPITYFIELGGIGTGASAEKLAGKPIYADGFLASVGFRWYPY